jgi:hypothetical protein
MIELDRYSRWASIIESQYFMSIFYAQILRRGIMMHVQAEFFFTCKPKSGTNRGVYRATPETIHSSAIKGNFVMRV